jgi:hypothetical protein
MPHKCKHALFIAILEIAMTFFTGGVSVVTMPQVDIICP